MSFLLCLNHYANLVGKSKKIATKERNQSEVSIRAMTTLEILGGDIIRSFGDENFCQLGYSSEEIEVFLSYSQYLSKEEAVCKSSIELK